MGGGGWEPRNVHKTSAHKENTRKEQGNRSVGMGKGREACVCCLPLAPWANAMVNAPPLFFIGHG